MIMKKPTDVLITGGSQSLGIRFAYVDATDSATALSRNHLAGPAASAALGDGLAAIALLGADLTEPEAAVSLHLKTTAPIQSILVEATFEGTLRGFTGKKLLPEFDELGEDLDVEKLFQGDSQASVIFSKPGRIIAQSNLQHPGLTPAEAVKAYYRLAAQRIVEVVCRTEAIKADYGVEFTHAILVELMPEGNEKEFDRILAEMKTEAFKVELENNNDPIAILSYLGINDVTIDPVHNLAFACRCSRHMALSTLRALPKDELMAMALRDKNTDIYCHMCGKCHSITPEEIRTLASEK